VLREIGDHLLLRVHDDSSHLHELRADARATPVRQGAFLDAAVVRDVLVFIGFNAAANAANTSLSSITRLLCVCDAGRR
jgi:hypothetical protein